MVPNELKTILIWVCVCVCVFSTHIPVGSFCMGNSSALAELLSEHVVQIKWDKTVNNSASPDHTHVNVFVFIYVCIHLHQSTAEQM